MSVPPDPARLEAARQDVIERLDCEISRWDRRGEEISAGNLRVVRAFLTLAAAPPSPPEKWVCGWCGFKNDRAYVICPACSKYGQPPSPPLIEALEWARDWFYKRSYYEEKNHLDAALAAARGETRDEPTLLRSRRNDDGTIDFWLSDGTHLNAKIAREEPSDGR